MQRLSVISSELRVIIYLIRVPDMSPLLDTKLISTRNASLLSGYTRDYIARLLRLRKISGEKIGRGWLVDKRSLEFFLDQRHHRKGKHRRKPASDRGLSNHAVSLGSLALNGHDAELTDRLPSALGLNSFRERAVALLTAVLVISFAAFSSQTPLFEQRGVAVFQNVARGFINGGEVRSHVSADSVAAQYKIDGLSHVSLIQSSWPQPLFGTFFRTPPPGFSSTKFFNYDLRQGTFFESKVRSIVLSIFTRITHPSIAAAVIIHTYIAIGGHAYTVINGSLLAYRSLVDTMGTGAFQLAFGARGLLTVAPKFVAKLNFAFGQAVIDAAHGAIHADVTLAYAIAAAAPESARVTVTFIGNVGDILAGATARAPALAFSGSVAARNAAARITSSLSESIFDAAYSQATRLVAFASRVTAHYLSFIYDTGGLAYEGARNVRHSMLFGGQLLAAVPAAFTDAYLGVMGKTFHTLFSSANAARSVVLAHTSAGQ
jgi:hypothetical protein